MTTLKPATEPGLPIHLAAIFMATVAKGQAAPLDLISLLSQMALGPDPILAQEATSSLYAKIILPLCDDFSTRGVEISNRILITMIQTFCRHPEGKETRQLLQDLQLTDQESFLNRHRQLIKPRPLPPTCRQAVKKVFILSRISLGADIAITSVIIARVKKALPQAQLFVVGPEHLGHLFYSDDLHHLDFSYQRDGSLLDKMKAWPRLYQLIGKETSGLTPEEILLFDPDTRLTQLGLLPLAALSSSHYLCTRLDMEAELSLPAITNNWLDHILPDTPSCPPHFRINPKHLERCRLFCQHLGPNTFKIVINLGVGNDDNKRLGDDFEKELIATLLMTKNTMIILDSGRGATEETRAKSLMAKMAKRGYNTAELSEGQLTDAKISFQHGLLRFTGKIDAMAGLIDSSDLFIGYDSCGQHVATATETPAIICFTGAANKRFLQRWQPNNHHGKTTTHIINNKPLSHQKRLELIADIIKTADHYRS